MMLLGIYLHVSCAYSNIPDTWWFGDTAKSVFFDASLAVIHIFRMPLFMVMAGFFGAMLLERRGEWGFVKNRLLRVGVPLVLGVPLLVPVLKFLAAWARHLGEPGAAGDAAAKVASFPWLRFLDPTHLWFLEYLLLCCGMTLILRRVLPDWLAGREWFGRIWRSGWVYVIWPAVTFATLTVMEMGLLDTPHRFTPDVRIAVAYEVFFGFGWLLFAERETLGRLAKRAWTLTGAGLVAAAGSTACALMQLDLRPASSEALRLGTAAFGAVSAWLLIFGLTGLFLRYLYTHNETWRYLSDASYWMYIMHPVAVLSFQMMVAEADLAAGVKCVIALTGSTAVLLASYQLLVRRTWVGVLLNGKRAEAPVEAGVLGSGVLAGDTPQA